MKTRVVFFGTPSFAVPMLEALADSNDFEVVLIVTQPDRPVGRKHVITPPPVKTVASTHDIPCLQPEKITPEIAEQILNLNPDVGVVVAYGNMIPKRLLHGIPHGVVNIHPSLLPAYRGASPRTYPILKGDAETGITLMLLDEQLDHGPIISQYRIPLEDGDTTESLSQRLMEFGAKILLEDLPKYLKGEIKPVAQDDSKATHAPLITTDAARIDWNQDVRAIERLVRAMYGVTPAWTTVAALDKKMLIMRSGYILEKHEHAPGMLLNFHSEPAVAVPGGYIVLKEIQLAGGKKMDGHAFLNGYRELVGTILK